MALRNQPYIPLYVQDFLTDEKLNECSAESTGVYIKIMCLLHKQDQYGKFLLKQKDKQKESMCLNFALKLVKHLPFTVEVIERSLRELFDEGVLTLNGDGFYQKRMVKDNDISEKRSRAGSEGGKKTQFAKAKVEANIEANSENENENENINNSNNGTVIFDAKVLESELKKQFTQNEALMRSQKIDEPKLMKLIENFVTHLQSQDKIDKPLKTQREYLPNWIRSELAREKKSNPETPKKANFTLPTK